MRALRGLRQPRLLPAWSPTQSSTSSMAAPDAPISPAETPRTGNDLESLLARIHQIADGTLKGGGPSADSPANAVASPTSKAASPANPNEIHARPSRSTPSIPSPEDEAAHWRPLEPQSLKSAGL